MIQPLIKSLALIAPPLRRLVDQRDRLLAECRALEGERERLAAQMADMAKARRAEKGNVAAPRSNVEHWKRLQERGYFEHHPCYEGLRAFGNEAPEAIERFLPLQPSQKVVVIGCGYGRDSVQLAQRVGHIWGIDVSRTVLEKAAAFTAEQGVRNFTPVLADEYKEQIPDGIDVVFSIVVMQHLTRHLVRDYFQHLGAKLAPRGVFVVQFLEELAEGVESADAELADHEPSVSWTARQLVSLAADTGLALREIHTMPVTPTALWHWACFSRRDAQS